jgi:branched-chain amino acid transport system ATP-binding protein
MNTPTNTSAPLLSLQGVHAHYGKSHILHGIDLAIGRGEVVSLLGRNGAGRSTTMKSIMGLVDVTGGRIAVEGRDITNKRPFEIARAGLGFVPEEREVFANLTVDENLRMGEQPRRDDAPFWSADQMFDYFPRLKERRDQLAGTLSGGEQQMLAMARAVMLNPELVLLDEPSMGLAPILVEEVFRIIARLKDEGVTMLLVEQFAAAALNVADYGYVLENGRISVHGSADKLKHDPAVVAAYLGGSH